MCFLPSGILFESVSILSIMGYYTNQKTGDGGGVVLILMRYQAIPLYTHIANTNKIDKLFSKGHQHFKEIEKGEKPSSSRRLIEYEIESTKLEEVYGEISRK